MGVNADGSRCHSASADLAAAAPLSAPPGTDGVVGGGGGGGGGGESVGTAGRQPYASSTSTTRAVSGITVGQHEMTVTDAGLLHLTVKVKVGDGPEQTIEKLLRVRVGGQVLTNMAAVSSLGRQFDQSLVIRGMVDQFLENAALDANHRVVVPGATKLRFVLNEDGFRVHRMAGETQDSGSQINITQMAARTGQMTGQRRASRETYQAAHSEGIRLAQSHVQARRTLNDMFTGYSAREQVQALERIIGNNSIQLSSLPNKPRYRHGLASGQTIGDIVKMPANQGLALALQDKLRTARQELARENRSFFNRGPSFAIDPSKPEKNPLLKLIFDTVEPPREMESSPQAAPANVVSAGNRGTSDTIYLDEQAEENGELHEQVDAEDGDSGDGESGIEMSTLGRVPSGSSSQVDTPPPSPDPSPTHPQAAPAQDYQELLAEAAADDPEDVGATRATAQDADAHAIELQPVRPAPPPSPQTPSLLALAERFGNEVKSAYSQLHGKTGDDLKTAIKGLTGAARELLRAFIPRMIIHASAEEKTSLRGIRDALQEPRSAPPPAPPPRRSLPQAAEALSSTSTSTSAGTVAELPHTAATEEPADEGSLMPRERMPSGDSTDGIELSVRPPPISEDGATAQLQEQASPTLATSIMSHLRSLSGDELRAEMGRLNPQQKNILREQLPDMIDEAGGSEKGKLEEISTELNHAIARDVYTSLASKSGPGLTSALMQLSSRDKKVLRDSIAFLKQTTPSEARQHLTEIANILNAAKGLVEQLGRIDSFTDNGETVHIHNLLILHNEGVIATEDLFHLIHNELSEGRLRSSEKQALLGFCLRWAEANQAMPGFDAAKPILRQVAATMAQPEGSTLAGTANKLNAFLDTPPTTTATPPRIVDGAARSFDGVLAELRNTRFGSESRYNQAVSNMARDFTRMQEAHRTNLSPVELARGSGAHESENVQNYRHFLEQMSYTISSQILNETNPESCRRLIKFFMNIGAECLRAGDKASAKAIHSALSQVTSTDARAILQSVQADTDYTASWAALNALSDHDPVPFLTASDRDRVSHMPTRAPIPGRNGAEGFNFEKLNSLRRALVQASGRELAFGRSSVRERQQLGTDLFAVMSRFPALNSNQVAEVRARKTQLLAAGADTAQVLGEIRDPAILRGLQAEFASLITACDADIAHLNETYGSTASVAKAAGRDWQAEVRPIDAALVAAGARKARCQELMSAVTTRVATPS